MIKSVSIRELTLTTLVATIADAIVYAVTANGIMTIVLIPFLIAFFAIMFGFKGVIKPAVKVIATVIMVVALILCMVYGRVKPNDNLTPDGDTLVETTGETNNDENNKNCCCCGCPYCCGGQQNGEDGTDAEANAGDVSRPQAGGKKYGNSNAGGMTPTYGGESAANAGNGKETPKAEAKVEGDNTFKAQGNGGEPQMSEEQKQQLQQDIEDGKNVEEHSSGVVTTTDDNTTNKKPEDENQQEPFDHVEELKPGGDEKDNPNSDKTPKPEEKPGPMTDEELNNYGNDNNDKPEEEQPGEDNIEPAPEPEPEIVPVSIKALADEAIAGDTIQFEIKGTVEKITGFDGISVEDIKGGILSIATPKDVTQVITITVEGKDGSKATASVSVKSIKDQAEESKPQEAPGEDTIPDDGNDIAPEEKPTYKPVTIRVDSKEAYVGDTVQFFIDGDIETLTGAGKSVTDIKNGVLSVEAKEEGSITITVTGKDGSSDSATVTVKALPTAQPQPEVQKPAETPTPEEETKPQTTPVSISVIGGTDKVIAGETVQFKISGDVKSIEGLDGLNYTRADNILTINTNEGEATVIEVVVNGVDGSTASAVVTVTCM